MKVKLVTNQPDKSIHPKDLKVGDIAVITHWTKSSPFYIGRIVELVCLYKDKPFLNTVGSKNENWDNWETLSEDCKVRLLEPGESIVIE